MTSVTAMPIIGALSACLCGLLAAFLLLVKGPLRHPNRLLAGFLLLTGLDVAGWMVPLVPPGWRGFLAFRLPLAFLQMPLLYDYMARLCFPDSRAAWNWIAAVLAAAASVLSLLPRAAAITGFSVLPLESRFDLMANEVALHLQFYIYAALMFGLLLRYRQARGRTGHAEPSLVGPWIGTMLAVSLGAHSLVLLKSWAWIGSHDQIYARLDLAVGLIAVGIGGALTLTAMLRQPLFVGLPSPPPTSRRRAMQPDFDASGPDADGSAALAELDRYMAEHQPFLDPALTVRALARRIGMGQRELSVLLNQKLGVHFFDYVNRYRVEKAAALLADETHRSTTVLEIAHMAGFNTKSSFNAAFSKHRGETPTQHRARVQPSSADR
jgi:AraC-like DNA-binding protein